MPRQNNRTADVILTADLHLRDDTPECRTDNFAAARNRKMAWLRDLQTKHGCPIIDAGDVFNRWQVSSELEGWALLNLPPGIITVPGNHDLPQHSLKLYKKSSLHVLEAAGKVEVLKEITETMFYSKFMISGFAYDAKFRDAPKHNDKNMKQIAIIHAYVAETVPPFIEGYTPAQLLAALPGYDLIVSGHNHASFTFTARNGRMVVNPGSMMRTTADQADMKPRVYLWYADTNAVEEAHYPAEPGVVSRKHLEKTEERDARMEAFVSRLDAGGVEAGLSFEKNVEAFMVKNKTRQEVRDVVRKACDG